MGYFIFFVLWNLAVGGLCYFNGYQTGQAAGIHWASDRIYGPQS